jgi:hypothetical protein
VSGSTLEGEIEMGEFLSTEFMGKGEPINNG